MISLVLASASAVAVVPANLDGVLRPDDYPIWALHSDESAAALVDVLVEPSGRVSRCVVKETFGSQDLAKEICKIVMKKRVRPPRDFEGKEAYGVVRTVLKMWLQGSRGQQIAKVGKAADVALTVPQLPGGNKAAEAEVVLAVDETGHATYCGAKTDQDPKDLVEAICSVRDQLGAEKVVDTVGEAINYVTTKKVELRVGGTTAVRN